MAVPRFCWRLRIGGSVDRSGEGGGEGVEQIAQQGSRPTSIHPRQDHVRSRQEDLGTPANYAWEYGRTRCSPVLQPPSIAGGRRLSRPDEVCTVRPMLARALVRLLWHVVSANRLSPTVPLAVSCLAYCRLLSVGVSDRCGRRG